MKNVVRLVRVMVLFSFFGFLSSCEKGDTTETGLNPFSNGGDERNLIVVISDIHLGANLAYAECNGNLEALEKLLYKIKAAPTVKELVIAGDMLDEWFVPADVDTYQGGNQADFVRRIATTNKGVFDALKGILHDGKIRVTYVPGNHDLTITAANVESILPGIHQARDAEQGLGTYSPIDLPELAIEHGHRYNFFCAPDPISNQEIAPGTILPPGYFYTRIAVLHVMQEPTVAADTVPAITLTHPEDVSQYMLYVYWNVWKSALSSFPIENTFDEKIIVTNIDGFTGNFAVNDLLPYQTTAGGMIDVNLYKGVQDSWVQRQALNHVAVTIPIAQAIANAAKSSESEFQATNQYFLNPNATKRIVIFGHTHDAKIIASNNFLNQKCIYANSGTWIDHNTVAATTTNFVVVTPQGADATSQTYVRLYNYENQVVTEMAKDSLRY